MSRSTSERAQRKDSVVSAGREAALGGGGDVLEPLDGFIEPGELGLRPVHELRRLRRGDDKSRPLSDREPNVRRRISRVVAIELPAPVPVTTTRFRTPKKNIPQTKKERDALLAYIREFLAREPLVPPMPLDELRVHAERLIAETGYDPIYLHYTAVLLNNEMWREALAAIPFERRLLLMPKCLRVESKCPAPFDEFGLLCKQCGLCTIQDFQNEAEALGYAVLVAEGSAIVMSLIQTGQIEAIVGISCLPVLERTFPYVEAAAIPAVAVPLLQDDCIDTTVDIDWVWEYLHLTSEDKTRRLNLNALKDEVAGWFGRDSLDSLMGQADGAAETIARDWLAGKGSAGGRF